MTKKLDEFAMQSELSGSAFFSGASVPTPVEPEPVSLPRSEPQSPPPSPVQVEPAPSRPQLRRRNEQGNETTNVRPKLRSIERRKIRHSFDIYNDQLLSLRELTLERERTFGERVLIGELVQEALDALITKERNKQ